MIQLYFRDLRRRVERLERHYFRPTPKRVVLHFLDENDVPYLSIYPGAEQPEVRYPPLGPEDYAGDNGSLTAAPPPAGAGHAAQRTQPTSAAKPTGPTPEPASASPAAGAPRSAPRPGFFLLAPAAVSPGLAANSPPATFYRPRARRRAHRCCRHGPSPSPGPGGIHHARKPKAAS